MNTAQMKSPEVYEVKDLGELWQRDKGDRLFALVDDGSAISHHILMVEIARDDIISFIYQDKSDGKTIKGATKCLNINSLKLQERNMRVL